MYFAGAVLQGTHVLRCGLSFGRGGWWSFFRPGPGVVDDGREQCDLDGAAEDVVVPLPDRASDDGERIHDAQCDVDDSVDSWSQGE